MKATIKKNLTDHKFELIIKDISAGELLAMRNALSRYHTSIGESVSKIFNDAAIGNNCLIGKK